MHLPEGKIAIFAAGANLRALRERLGLTMREVETASTRIAERHANDEFVVSPSLAACPTLRPKDRFPVSSGFTPSR